MQKYLLLLILGIIGMIMPETTTGAVTLDTSTSGTVIIKSSQPGDLSASWNSISNTVINATTIVFEGSFSQNDMDILPNADQANWQAKKVDMSKAVFTNNSIMSFSRWKNHLEEAITPANVTSVPPYFQLCDGCTKLKSLTLSGGDLSNLSLGNNVSSLETVIIKNKVSALGKHENAIFSNKTSIKNLIFEDGDANSPNLSICESCFSGCTGIQDLTLPTHLSSLGKDAFMGTTGVKSIVIKEESRLTRIPENAFIRCGNNNGGTALKVTIPKSITLIEKFAFGEMKNLKEVTFQGGNTEPLVIKTFAFRESHNIADVYVDVNPAERALVCEYEGFDFDAMDGQTQPSNPMATLHFKEEYWDYYQGNWKKGMGMDHEDLLEFRDGKTWDKYGNHYVNTKGQTSQLVDQSTNKAILASQSGALDVTGHIAGKQPANGWQQFAKTGTGIDIIVPKGKYFRTYSTPVAQVKPDWMKIYRVTNFSDGYVEGQSDASSSTQANAAAKQAYTLEIVEGSEELKCVPENTGVIRVDEVEKDEIYYFKEWEPTRSASYNTYPYNKEDVGKKSSNKANLLMPTNGETVTLNPVEKENSVITFRIFGLLKTGEFSRAKVGTKLADHRAYLRLPADMFHWQDEKNGSSQDATGEASVSSTAKISVLFDCDDFFGSDHGITTAIIKAIEDEQFKNDAFYTLQGVRVSRPTTKGVYIHNGKKVYIK